MPAGCRALVAWSFPSAGFAVAAEQLARLRAEIGGGAAVLHLAGGPHPTAEPEPVLRAGFDLVACGEGERTLALLLERLHEGADPRGPGLAWLEDGSLRRGAAPPPVDLDAVPPFPASCSRGGAIEITRGCAHACRFCQTRFAKGDRLRHRSPEVVARWAAAQVEHGRPDVRFITSSALAYGSEDGAHVGHRARRLGGGPIISEDGKPSLKNMRAKLAACCLVDDKGNRLFSNADVEVLGRKSARALERVVPVAQKLNRLGEAQLEEVRGN